MKKKVYLSSLSWLIYNMLKDGEPRTSAELNHDIHKVFNLWSRAFIDRKIKDGIDEGYLTRSKPCRGPYYCTVATGDDAPIVLPQLEDMYPEVLFYLKDVDNLNKLKDLTVTKGCIFNPEVDDNSDKMSSLIATMSKTTTDLKVVLLSTMIITLEKSFKRKNKRRVTACKGKDTK